MRRFTKAETALVCLSIDVSNAIAKAMDRRGHSQKCLAPIAKYAGITRAALLEVMKGDCRDLTVNQLMRIARFLGCRAQIFLTDESVDEWAVHRAVAALQDADTKKANA